MNCGHCDFKLEKRNGTDDKSSALEILRSFICLYYERNLTCLQQIIKFARNKLLDNLNLTLFEHPQELLIISV